METEKVLTYSAMGVAGLVALIFVLPLLLMFATSLFVSQAPLVV